MNREWGSLSQNLQQRSHVILLVKKHMSNLSIPIKSIYEMLCLFGIRSTPSGTHEIRTGLDLTFKEKTLKNKKKKTEWYVTQREVIPRVHIFIASLILTNAHIYTLSCTYLQ